MTEEGVDKTIYKVVMNHEEQYSIWPADRENALGWKDAGKVGSKEECTLLSEDSLEFCRLRLGDLWAASQRSQVSNYPGCLAHGYSSFRAGVGQSRNYAHCAGALSAAIDDGRRVRAG